MRTDAGGAYIWNTTTSKWYQVICQTCIPQNATAGSFNFGYYPDSGSSQIFQAYGPALGDQGVLDLVGAPSDATTAYVFKNGHVLVSTTADSSHPENLRWTDTGQIYSSAITNATWATTSGGQATFTVTRLPSNFSTSHFFKVTGMTPSGYNGNYVALSINTGASTVTAALVSILGAIVSSPNSVG